MREKKVLKIDFSRRRLRERAEKFYDEGNYLSALRFTYKEMSLYGGDGDIYTMLSDIYENMELYSSAVNCWFRFMDNCSGEDLPDIYEGLAVNYLNMGNEAQSAFYYNKLIDADDELTEENKAEIAEAFSEPARGRLRLVYPPRFADYSKETEAGTRALKNGDCKKAVSVLSRVEKGSPDYRTAREIQAVAHLLSDNAAEAEKICLELLEEKPTDVQAMATLAAVYTQQGRKEESRAIALRLCENKSASPEELYKIATVCCENNLHGQALEKFVELEKDIPYDGNMLYFKSVAAYKSGKEDLAISTMEKLCTIYPDAAVAEYYLKAMRRHRNDPEHQPEPEITYFYRVPPEERANRCRALIRIGKYPRTEAELFGTLAAKEGYFRWCFDEMDGMERDLQYLAIVVAEHARADETIRDILLDCEVSDLLKIELLRLLYARNEANGFGVVICNIYRDIRIDRVKIGQKRHRKFVDAYAKTASKFTVINDAYGRRIRESAEALYRSFRERDCWELAASSDDLACAIYLLSGLKEIGKDARSAAGAFDADPGNVEKILAAAEGEKPQEAERRNLSRREKATAGLIK